MDDERAVMPLREAYRFGELHGLEREMAEIRDMEIEWDLAWTSSVRKGYVIDLLASKQLLDSFKDQYWPAGKSAWGESQSKFYLRLKSRYEDFLAGHPEAVPEAVIDATETTFGLERDLQNALRHNIEQLEHGLKITDDGKERHVLSGFIDITTEDKQGRTVVIELKAGTADRETIGQILGYMGDLQRESKKPVRGIIVAGDFSIHTKSALSALPNLELKKYAFKFSFEAVSGDARSLSAKL